MILVTAGPRCSSSSAATWLRSSTTGRRKAGPPSSTGSPSGSPASSAPRARTLLVRLYDEHRDARVKVDVRADAAEEVARNPPQPARAEDEQVVVTGLDLLDDLLAGVPALVHGGHR